MSDYFKDIREIIENGYLTLSCSINNISLKIKNPTPEIIIWASEFSEDNTERSVALLSKIILSVSGRDNDKDFFYEIYDILLNSQIYTLLSNLYIYANHLMKKASSSNKYLEAYCYTEESRYLWKAWKARSLFTTHKLQELNNTQISWVIWNEAEDERIESDRDWEKAFFVASATNPKGVEAVQKKWKAKDRDEILRREELLEFVSKGLLNEDSETPVKRKPKKRHKTMEDLEEEMRKWVSGEEDEHDIIVRSYKEEVQKNIDDMLLKAQEIKKANRQKRIDIDNAITGISLVGLTEDDVRKKIKPHDNATPNIIDVNKNIINNFIVKPNSGNLSIQDGQVVNHQPSLMDKISQRKPTME